jgi:ABC-type multidrug transport system fused ATPase/permease subunit
MIFMTDQSLMYWAFVLLATVAVWSYNFLFVQASEAVCREEAKKAESTTAMMHAVLAYTREEEQKEPPKQKLPEATRLLDLLWDDVHEVRTSKYNLPSELNAEVEVLFKRVHTQELRKTIDKTHEARKLMAQPKSKSLEQKDIDMVDALKELGEHESGEKLFDAVKLATDVKKNLGPDFIDEALLKEARETHAMVYKDQAKNMASLLKLIRPVLPNIGAACAITIVRHVLCGRYHQIGIWASVIEGAAGGDMQLALETLFQIWVGHLIIKFFEFTEDTYAKRAQSLFGQRVRSGVLAAMIRQDYEYFDKTPAGVLQDRLNRDADKLGDNLIYYPKDMFARATWIVVNLVLVMVQTPLPLFLAACVPVLFMICFQYFIFRKFKRSEERQRKVDEEAVAATSQVLRQMKTVRQFAMEPMEAANYASAEQARHHRVEEEHVSRRFLETASWAFFDSGLALVMLIGIPYVARGEMTVSQLVDTWCKLNFNICFCLRHFIEELPRMGKLLHPLGRICDLLQASPAIEPTGDSAFASAANHAELEAILSKCEDDEATGRMIASTQLETDCAADDATSDTDNTKRKDIAGPAAGAQLIALTNEHQRILVKGRQQLNERIREGKLTFPMRAVFSTKLRPDRFRGKIEFRNVFFSYPTETRKPVLQGISFVVEPGQKVALVGATGCGKSSCMALLQRLYEPQSGQILIDDHPIEDYDVHFLRSRIVIVDQATVLFNATIRDNITYGTDATDEEVIQACKDAKAWEFIDDKPDKLMTMIAPGGSNLSGGQKQRLAIARAMIRKPDVILLDEATSALDNENEAKVQGALDKLAKRGSALVIAHRLTTVMDSDKIVVVDKGLVVEEGTHVELLAKTQQQQQQQLSTDAGSTRVVLPASRHGMPALQRQASELLSVPCLFRQSSVPLPCKNGLPEKSGASYKRLWDATTGDKESLSVKQMEARAEELAKELAGIKAKMAHMQDVKQSLLVSPPTGAENNRSTAGKFDTTAIAAPSHPLTARRSRCVGSM